MMTRGTASLSAPPQVVGLSERGGLDPRLTGFDHQGPGSAVGRGAAQRWI